MLSEKEMEGLSLDTELLGRVKKHREEIKMILDGRDSRKLLIVGPCSAWPSEAVIEYAKKLKKVEEKYCDKIKIVMRVYTQKPRSILGWQGSVIQPDPFGDVDVGKGIIYCRKMMLEVVKIGLPIADELLFTHLIDYFSDLISWNAIGARSSEDQEHRNFASMLDSAVGIKNPTSGDIGSGINSVIVAQNPQSFLFKFRQVNSLGNDYAHLVLRGGDKPNISKADLKFAIEQMKERNVKNPSVIVDLSHGNSGKDPLKQPKLLKDVLKIIKTEKLNEIKGFMVESFLKTGKQELEKDFEPGISITDSCLGFDETEKMTEEFWREL